MTAPPALDPQAALFVDVDGTLLEIAPGPDLVQVPPSLPDLLLRLSTERDGALALISGRPITELDRLFRPWQGAAAGLHGVERRCPDGRYASAPSGDADRAAAAALDRLRSELEALARQWPGVFL
ncbi:MAG TPA: trehalose-phosphatase, partial [Stellaceae bacterium]